MNTMFIRLVTDSANNSRGFTATVNTVRRQSLTLSFLAFLWFLVSTQLNLTQTQVYLKAVAERLKKMQCSARTDHFKNTIKRTQYKNIQQLIW